jgi:hypothetical protein
MKTVDITELAYRHGFDAADHFWQVDPADEDMAAEWVRNAEAGTLHDYALPGAFDEMPADLDTEGWSWSDLAEYGTAWESGYIARTTELCRKVIEADNER